MADDRNDEQVADALQDVKYPESPYKDLSGGIFPRDKYLNVASTNFAARGLEQNELIYGGSTTDLNLNIKDLPPSEYPLNQVRETIAGHVTEYDDTPGRERVLFKHSTGSGVDMRPDGTVIINTRYNRIEITGGDQKVIVQGDGEIFYHGNLKLNVSGDMDVEVGGNYNLKVHGDKREDIRGNYQQKVGENHETSVTENKSSFVLGTNTDTILTDNNLIVKGDHTTRVEKNINQFAGEDTLITSESEFSMSTKNANLAANDMVVQSTTGMIGGDNVFYYAKNYYGTSATFTAGVTAPTFSGDLTGKADDANQADYATSAGQAPSGVAGNPGSNTHVDTDTSIRTSFPAPGPDASWLNDYLTQTGYGYRIVDIDVGDVIRDEINKSTEYGGISKATLTTREVRSKLRDPLTARNARFIGRAQAEGLLSASYIDQKPSGFEVGRIENSEGSARKVDPKTLFPGTDPTEKIEATNNLRKVTTLVPSQLYNPEAQFVRDGVIDAKTALAKGIKVGRFLGGHGDPQTLNAITDDTERVQIAKNLYLHAEFMYSIQEHLNDRNRYSLQVVEGFYTPTEELEVDSLNYKMSKGQCVVYELRDRNGLIPIQHTFDLATHIKDFYNFEKMILDYDTYNPNGELNVQIILVMPTVTAQWTVVYENEIETRYNNYVQTNGELIELL